jgi:plasmid stabilization system protein ParE
MDYNRIAFFLVAAVLTACEKPQIAEAAPQTPEQIMDQVESTIRLPVGADPLELYGRNYAFSGDGKVVAVYYAHSDDRGRVLHAVAGERRWHDWEGELPFIMDGGCSIVHIDYEIATQHILSVSCNGEA